MKRVAGIGILLLSIMFISAIFEPVFLNAYNMGNIMRWTGLFGILSFGVAFVIMTGGIDLSVGSMVGLIGALSANFLRVQGLPIFLGLSLCIGISILIGLVHGIFVSKVKMQPFVVTLCGWFIYRGFARFTMNDVTQGYGNEFLGLKFLVKGKIPAAFWPDGQAPDFIASWSLPMPFVIMVILGIILAIFLNRSVYGRYILAIGRNENAARFSGINTDLMIIIAYILSSLCAGIGGILLSLDLNTVQPSTSGNMYELYAIAGCVVGGCSLRGGEGSILGVIIGTAIVRVLYNSINILGIPTQLEAVVVGLVILLGVASDELIKMYTARKRLSEVREAAVSCKPSEANLG